MEDRVRSPSTVREISWVEKFWPYEEMRERTRMHQKNEDYVTVPYSRVQLFPIQEFIRSVRLPKMVRPQFVCLGAFVSPRSLLPLPARLKRQGGAKKESDSLVKNKVVSVNVPIKPSVYSLDLDKMVTFLEAEMNRTLWEEEVIATTEKSAVEPLEPNAEQVGSTTVSFSFCLISVKPTEENISLYEGKSKNKNMNGSSGRVGPSSNKSMSVVPFDFFACLYKSFIRDTELNGIYLGLHQLDHPYLKYFGYVDIDVRLINGLRVKQVPEEEARNQGQVYILRRLEVQLPKPRGPALEAFKMMTFGRLQELIEGLRIGEETHATFYRIDFALEEWYLQPAVWLKNYCARNNVPVHYSGCDNI
ncbi:hypothetical protein L596_022670 [Steinernema carpocapsae]|nr:hypothetical protein L596_022670 [Steinernema carpocapsae]